MNRKYDVIMVGNKTIFDKYAEEISQMEGYKAKIKSHIEADYSITESDLVILDVAGLDENQLFEYFRKKVGNSKMVTVSTDSQSPPINSDNHFFIGKNGNSRPSDLAELVRSLFSS